MLNIGSVARATGISANTLRTWERRYGFPVPERTDSGQRVYRSDIVAHLRDVARALEAGHRPRQVLAMALDDLRHLLGEQEQDQWRTLRVTEGERSVPGSWKRAVMELDEERLGTLMRQSSARLGALPFLDDRIGPFLNWIGESWSAGQLGIHHEHFASDVTRNNLDQYWRDLASSGRPQVVCASLPGEAHNLGIYICAVAVATVGHRPIVLPGQTPPSAIAEAAHALGAHHVIISLSVVSVGPQFTQALNELRRDLPIATRLIVGGSGAPDAFEGGIVVTSLAGLAAHLEDFSR